MTTSVKAISVPVAEGRPCNAVVTAVDYSNAGHTVYGCTLNPQGALSRLLSVPVQNAPYALEGSAQGLPLEALYAILKDQLAIEIGTVGEVKKEALTSALGLLNASLDILLGVNAVPEQVGEVNA